MFMMFMHERIIYFKIFIILNYYELLNILNCILMIKYLIINKNIYVFDIIVEFIQILYLNQ